jgi:N-acetylglucosaminyl-diphospho-decaprenol L-rhamnosyltransferase
VYIDAIIVTYDSEAEIAGAVKAARSCDAVRRVIVVDNASTDDSVAAAVRAGADDVLRGVANEGFAKAVNKALATTDAPRILLLNPDARIDDLALGLLSGALDREPRAALAGPVLVSRDGAVELGAARFSTVFNRVGMCLPLFGRLSWLRPDYPHADELARRGAVTPVDGLWGAVVLADGGFLRAVGGFDTRFFLFSEDEDLCRQARARGRLVLLVAAARATHIGGSSSSDTALREARRLFAAGQLLEKWEGRDAAARYARGVHCVFRLREALFGAASPVAPAARQRAVEARRVRESFVTMAADGKAR